MYNPIKDRPISLGEAVILPEGKGYWKSWEKRVKTAGKQYRAILGKNDPREVEVDFSIFKPKNYLLSHATIVGGVEPDTNGYWIVPPHGRWVNDNGNAWLNQVLLESYKSFILAENYLEHIQIKELSKGKILDAVAWVVQEDEPGYKSQIPTVFIDILVATDKRNHPKLVEKILKGKIKTLSMGCNISHSQCSKCGEVFEEGEEQCEHIEESLGEYFKGPDGKKRRIAELCGRPNDPGSCDFIEASWVGTPAFSPAVMHSTLKVGDNWLGRPLRAYVPEERLKEAAREAGWD